MTAPTHAEGLEVHPLSPHHTPDECTRNPKLEPTRHDELHSGSSCYVCSGYVSTYSISGDASHQALPSARGSLEAMSPPRVGQSESVG
jgi:hypothetical protein